MTNCNSRAVIYRLRFGFTSFCRPSTCYKPALCLPHVSALTAHILVFGFHAKSAACRASKEADKAAAAAAKEERLRVMQERLATWQASQAK